MECGLLKEEPAPDSVLLPEPPVSTSLHTYVVQRIDLLETIDGYATATPVRKTDLYFTEAGRVRTLNVEVEDRVSAGQILAQLEIADLQHRLELAEIDVALAQVRLERTEVVGSVFEEQEQRLALQRARADLRYLQGRIASATITAPYDGIIQRVQVKPSDLVLEYEPVIEILDPSELELQMRVSEDDYIRITAGDRARIELQRGSWTEGEVIQTTHRNPRLDAAVRRDEYLVHLAPLETIPDLELNAGMEAQVIVGESLDTLVIPKAGLRSFRDRTYVRVLDGEKRYEVDVRVGIETQTQVEILEGLREGVQVISR
jgi:macrolide-specific efflux system membrane fusion protein